MIKNAVSLSNDLADEDTDRVVAVSEVPEVPRIRSAGLGRVNNKKVNGVDYDATFNIKKTPHIE